jgi:hypothetical protein
VPMPRRLDDQPARARWAREAGVGEGVSTPLDPELEQRLGHLLDPSRRKAMNAAIRALDFRNGASDAARILAGMVEGSPAVGPGKSVPGGTAPAKPSGQAARAPRSPNPPPAPPTQRSSRRDALAVSAQLIRRVGLRLPLIVARRAIDRFRNPPPPAAKLAVDALGLDGDELLESLRGIAAEHGIEPGRLLAITDSLDFPALRRAGFAFEYVPSEQRAEPILRAIGETYADFTRRRVAAATAGRRRAPLIDLSRS